ncbi:hypothetical protein M441DRAFT_42434 [Trichoderma asperellum CBS 433.97]|uniref:Uncharacterized protein n=1 Tax=Trichoderma asperellum (strain ATCC 204424 / CBS 433.97 / NBRC 101777) TaxID=1042311 RepID=A0A2T3ZPC5_TRIA4|nr:hypothetical protein M441DRAFT_42434 [Trichoderma asperellum CBS 433.97]PTB46666.1 hypothetical protein M441DRAFT_42434 [Trichoderma asperellum CBS 433.97]
MCPLWALALVLALAVGAASWESGTATAGVWGTEYLLLGASCDGAPLQAAHTGQRTLGSTHWAWGAFPPARYLYLLPYLPAAEYCTWLCIARGSSYWPRAFAYQICEASGMILVRIASFLFSRFLTAVLRVKCEYCCHY